MARDPRRPVPGRRAERAGKDSLIGGALRPRGEPRFVFPRRIITVQPTPRTRYHRAVGEATFAHLDAAGGLMLSWRAHGLGYSIPDTAAGDLARGRSVVFNPSRSVIGEALDRFPPVRGLSISAWPRAPELARTSPAHR